MECKIVFHSSLNFPHITHRFLFVPNPNVVWHIGHRSFVERVPWTQIWLTQKFWRGVPMSYSLL